MECTRPSSHFHVEYSPFRIETGRFVKEEDRICELCNIDIENDQHVLYITKKETIQNVYPKF